MPVKLPASEGPVTNGPGRPLVDRVRERVLKADRAIERQETARRPRLRRATQRRRSPAAADSPPAEPLTREVRALRSVFTDLGAAHKQYRRRTGESVTPELRPASRGGRVEERPAFWRVSAVAHLHSTFDDSGSV